MCCFPGCAPRFAAYKNPLAISPETLEFLQQRDILRIEPKKGFQWKSAKLIAPSAETSPASFNYRFQDSIRELPRVLQNLPQILVSDYFLRMGEGNPVIPYLHSSSKGRIYVVHGIPADYRNEQKTKELYCHAADDAVQDYEFKMQLSPPFMSVEESIVQALVTRGIFSENREGQLDPVSGEVILEPVDAPDGAELQELHPSTDPKVKAGYDHLPEILKTLRVLTIPQGVLNNHPDKSFIPWIVMVGDEPVILASLPHSETDANKVLKQWKKYLRLDKDLNAITLRVGASVRSPTREINPSLPRIDERRGTRAPRPAPVSPSGVAPLVLPPEPFSAPAFSADALPLALAPPVTLRGSTPAALSGSSSEAQSLALAPALSTTTLREGEQMRVSVSPPESMNISPLPLAKRNVTILPPLPEPLAIDSVGVLVGGVAAAAPKGKAASKKGTPPSGAKRAAPKRGALPSNAKKAAPKQGAVPKTKASRGSLPLVPAAKSEDDGHPLSVVPAEIPAKGRSALPSVPPRRPINALQGMPAGGAVRTV